LVLTNRLLDQDSRSSITYYSKDRQTKLVKINQMFSENKFS